PGAPFSRCSDITIRQYDTSHRSAYREHASVAGEDCRARGNRMLLIANIVVALVAALHCYFLVLEMFLWTQPLGLKAFRNAPEKRAAAAVLAANQRLYNGFLAAGLIWGLVHPNAGFAF